MVNVMSDGVEWSCLAVTRNVALNSCRVCSVLWEYTVCVFMNSSHTFVCACACVCMRACMCACMHMPVLANTVQTHDTDWKVIFPTLFTLYYLTFSKPTP